MKKLTSILSVLVLTVSGTSLFAADHLEAPAVMDDGRLDINDLYAFQSFEDAERSVLILTVNPAAGVISPTSFNPAGRYLFEIDNTGDAVADIVYEATFSRVFRNGRQRFLIRRNGAVVVRGMTGSPELPMRAPGRIRARCGVFDDPFFFDLNGFNDGFNFTGDDFFAGLNVSAIVLEVPNSQLNGQSTNISVHSRTIVDNCTFDRMGRPAINTALIPDGLENAFNSIEPKYDFVAFGDIVQQRIEELNGGDSATASALAATLLPDVLTFDTSSTVGFLNGRKLADDVIDAELDLLTNGAVPTDLVDSEDEFLDVFPYLAAPN